MLSAGANYSIISQRLRSVRCIQSHDTVGLPTLLKYSLPLTKAEAQARSQVPMDYGLTHFQGLRSRCPLRDSQSNSGSFPSTHINTSRFGHHLLRTPEPLCIPLRRLERGSVNKRVSRVVARTFPVPTPKRREVPSLIIHCLSFQHPESESALLDSDTYMSASLI